MLSATAVGTGPLLWPPPGPAGRKASLGWVRVLRCAKTLLRLAHSVLFGLGDAGRGSYPLLGPLSAVLEVRKAGEGAGSCMVTFPPLLPAFPSLLGTRHGLALLLSTPPTAGGVERPRGPRPLPALGLRASKVSIYSRPPQPRALSYQLKHFRVQAKKPKSILKKSLKGQTHTHTGLGWGGARRGVAMRLRKGSFLL